MGSTTDIVEKEMYTFNDKGGRSITLRPEGTAGAVRAYIENGLFNLPSPQKFYYMGPMFRYERPQAGRFREFHQIGVECFGVAEPVVDAEILLLLRNLLNELGFQGLMIELNSLGCSECRPSYRESLMRFFSQGIGEFCQDCQRRFERNPLRLLDCKNPKCIEQRKDAPSILDFLCDNCERHLERLSSLLKYMDLSYTLTPSLVRGLDYYTRTIFEVKSPTNLGSQNAIAAGGRYDNLVEEFGGPPTPAIGFAIGLERLAILLKEMRAGGEGRLQTPEAGPSAYIAFLGEEAERVSLRLAERLRGAGLWIETGTGGSLKSQLRRADKLKADYVIIIGEEELAKGLFKWKRLSDGSGGEVSEEEIERIIK